MNQVDKELMQEKGILTENEKASMVFRRSLFAVKDIQKGEPFTPENVRSIRPAGGMMPKELPGILGSTAACSIKAGEAIHRNMIGRKDVLS